MLGKKRRVKVHASRPDPAHNGIRLRESYDWQWRMAQISAVLGLIAMGVGYWLDGRSPTERPLWAFIAVGLGLPWLYVTLRDMYDPTFFRLKCPHCRKRIPAKQKWQCADCGQQHSGDTFLWRCRNKDCKERPSAVQCLHCKQTIALETPPDPALVPAYRKQGKPAILLHTTLSRAQRDDTAAIIFYFGISMSLGGMLYYLYLREVQKPTIDSYVWMVGGVGVILMAWVAKCRPPLDTQGKPIPKPVVNKKHVGPYARKAFERRLGVVQGLYLAGWTGWFGMVVWVGVAIYQVTYLQNMAWKAVIDANGDIFGFWCLMTFITAPVAVITHRLYTKHPLRFQCPHCRGYMPSNMHWICEHCKHVHPKDDQFFNSYLRRCANCKEPAARQQCPHCFQYVPLVDVETVAAPAPLPAPEPAEQNGGTAGGRIRVKSKEDGRTGTIDASDFDPNIMERL